MEKSIKISETQIKEATVTIKTITINNRKFTLATFRQIKIKSPINRSICEIKGDLIGKIRYDGVWILWVEKKELRRYKADKALDDIRIIQNNHISRLKRLYERKINLGLYFLVKEKVGSYIPEWDISDSDKNVMYYEERIDDLNQLLKNKTSSPSKIRDVLKFATENIRYLKGFDSHLTIVYAGCFTQPRGDLYESDLYKKTFSYLKEKVNNPSFEKTTSLIHAIKELDQIFIAT
jgi:hypothetical protein